MAERDSRLPDLKLPTLGGLNERPSPANLQAGQFDLLEGLYPAQVGLLRRIPGKVLLASLTGKVLSFGVTNNTNGDVLIQTTTGLYVYTLGELLGYATAPSLAFTALAEEEAMSQAIIVHREPNPTNGGSLQGVISGTDSSATADTFYPRRLTHLLVNESSTVTTFTAATLVPAANTATSGSFVLSPGSYRITGQFTFRHDGSGSSESFLVGLWNSTTGLFETQGGGDPIISSVTSASVGSSLPVNLTCYLKGKIVVATTNKTFEIRQKCNAQSTSRNLACCGTASGLTNTNVNGAAAPFYYAYIEILKTA